MEASKLELMERQARAGQREEELSEGLTDKAGRTRLLQSAKEFKEAVGVLSHESAKAHIEAALYELFLLGMSCCIKLTEYSRRFE